MGTLCVGCGLFVVGYLGILLYVLPSLQLKHRYATMLAAFIPYGILAFAGSVLFIGGSSKRWVKPLVAFAIVGVALQVWFAKPYWPKPSRFTGGVTFLTMNMRCNTPGMDEFVTLVTQVQPDVVVVVGLNSKMANEPDESLRRTFPYWTFHPMPGSNTCGSAVLSRTPVREIESASPSQPIVETVGQDSSLYILPVDAPTPTRGVRQWSEAFRAVTKAVAGLGNVPMVVAGDFNATREHAPLRSLIDSTGLRDAKEVAGAGWVPTFPSDQWYPALLGLDHVLIGRGMSAAGVRTHKVEGQEHHAVSVRISVPKDL